MQTSPHTLNHVVSQGWRISPIAILLVLDGVMLGGCIALFTVRNLLLDKCCSTEPMVGTVYNLLDYLIPYYLLFGGALIVLVGLTVVVWKAAKSTSSRLF